jgi:hypothetical protein
MGNQGSRARQFRRALTAVAAATALAACGEGDQSYPEEVVEAFVAACAVEAGAAAVPSCRCMIGEIAKTIPYDEFQAMDREAAEGTVLPAFAERLTAAAETCRKE